MFGRAGRTAVRVASGAPLAYGVLLTYNPENVAGVTAAGMGAAAYGGVGTVVTSNGVHTGAGDAVSAVLDWGRREQRRFVRLPNRVLAVVTDDAVILTPWYSTARDLRVVARWVRGSFTATPVHYVGQHSVRVTTHGVAAILSTRNGPWHRRARATLDAIVRTGS